MEFYGIYEVLSTIFSMSFGTKILDEETKKVVGVMPTEKVFILSLSIAGGVLALLFLLQGIGLYRMAKNRGFKHKWRAFIPFANTILMGKLAGECSVFKQKVKRIGLYVLILQILSLAVCVLSLVVEGSLFLKYSKHLDKTYWVGLPSNAKWLEKFYASSHLIRMIADLPYIFMLFILLLGLYRKYNAKNSMTLSIVTLMFPIARYLVVFAVRNNTAIDYEAYMRARREEFLRRQQQYGNPYGNPYGNSYGNPYGNPYNRPPNPYGGEPQTPPQDPFAEFAKDDDPFAEEESDSPFEEDFGKMDSSDGLFD